MRGSDEWRVLIYDTGETGVKGHGGISGATRDYNR